MRIYHLMILLLITATGLTQDKKPESAKWKYTGAVAGGLIMGAQEPSYMVQTIHGIKKDRWMVGIGAGLDYYMVRTVPLVAHGEYHLQRKKKSNPFAYVQAGPAWAWPDNDWKTKLDNVNIYEFKMGWLAESGFGFRFPMGKTLRGFISFGYSFKQANYQEMPQWWITPWPMPLPQENRIDQKSNMFRANIRFGLTW